MKLSILQACDEDKAELAELRVLAMRESLEAIGRFDPERARIRFLASFNATNTFKVILEGELVGFYVLIDKGDHFYLDHFYIAVKHHGRGIGSQLLRSLLDQADKNRKALKLGALKKSRSNDFYQRHGFVFTHEESFDNFYQYNPCDNNQLEN